MIATVAIGSQYEKEAQRLCKSLAKRVFIFTEISDEYELIDKDPYINGLYHKSNFANYIKKDVDGPLFFMDADMFTLKKDPFSEFKVSSSTEFACVADLGKWYINDPYRQSLSNYFDLKYNSGFMYFKNLQIAKKICKLWNSQYKKRIVLYNNPDRIENKHETDEWALMYSLKKLNIKTQLLDKKWNTWHLKTVEEIKNSNAIFFQSHNYLDILSQ